MGNIVGGLLLLGVWIGSVRLGKAWARALKAPYWAARLLAQIIGGGAVCALILSVTGRVTVEAIVLSALVAAIHANVVTWLMRDTPPDWPRR